MKKQDLQNKLQQPYSSETWKEIIKFSFPNVSFFQSHKDYPIDNDKINSFKQIGNVRMDDGKNLAMFEVTVVENVNIAKNRVELRKLVSKLIDQEQIHGVLAIYEQGKDDYRFTFTAKDTNIDETGDFVTTETDTKRFTYVLGKNQSCRTPSDRFFNLHVKKEKNEEIKIEDIEDAFSVDILNKEFFNKYKEHYETFIEYITGKRFVKEKGKWIEKFIHEPHQVHQVVFNSNDKHARNFVKLLLGRLTFIQFLQKKAWMGVAADEPKWQNGEPFFTHKLFDDCQNKEKFHSECLYPLFYSAFNKPNRTNDIFELTGTKVPYLNGGLFEENYKNTQKIDFPAHYFKNLLDFFAQYNFTIDENDPDDREIGIDPEMLGHIFENLLEDNKDKGAFYTPKAIVQYMCQESLIQFLKTSLLEKHSLDEQNIEKELQTFVRKKEAADLNNDYAADIANALKKVKICDPAIGSGAFPMGLLNEIYRCVDALYNASPDDVGEIWEMPQWNPATVKKNIIQNSIYGVDIEKGAVDIARLRFWLSLIVDEEQPEPLPNLDYKIMQGNSLLESFEGIDLSKIANANIKKFEPERDLWGNIIDGQTKITFSKDGLAEEIQNLEQKYFNVNNPIEKQNIKNKIEKLVYEHIDFNIELQRNSLIRRIDQAGDPEKLKTKAKKELEKLKTELEEIDLKKQNLDEIQHLNEKPYFLWHLFFKDVFDKGGFDIVIGNPPYLRVQEITRTQPRYKQFYAENYYVAKASYDLANLFFELAVNISNTNAQNSYIFPHKFFNSASTEIFREYLFKGKFIDKIVHFGANMIFNDADTYTCIAHFSPNKNEGFNLLKVEFKENWKTKLNKRKFNYISYNQLQKASLLYGANQWIFFKNKLAFNIFEKIYQKGTPIKEIFDRIFQGIATGKDELYIFIGEENNNYVIGNFIKSDEIKKIEIGILKPFLKGKQTQRYSSPSKKMFILFPYELKNGKAIILNEKTIKDKYPNAYEWLKENEKKHRKKDGGSTNDEYWYRYARNQGIDNVEQPKLSSMEICAKHPNVLLNKQYFFHPTTVYSWLKRDEIKEGYEFFLAIVNSKIIWWFLKNTGDTLQGDARRFKTNYLNPFPVPINVDSNREIKIKDKVNQTIENKKQGKDTTDLENEIDVMVYKLYELTYAEVLVIDPEFWLTEQEYNGLEY